MLEVTPIRAFNDNYLWLINPEGSRDCAVVDPGDVAPVLETLKAKGMTLQAIVITHHHGDHTGGIGGLREKFDCPVYGPESPNIPSITHPLGDGDEISILGQTFQVMEIPGHTLDHIAYFAAGTEKSEPLLFCGDTLFAGGCGRVFEGTPPMMHASLQKLAALPAATRVYCAHEYTLANLAFARAVLPEDSLVSERISMEQHRRNQDIPTVPTTIAQEKATNPFLRCDDPMVIEAASRHSGQAAGPPEEVFGVIRRWKDEF